MQDKRVLTSSPACWFLLLVENLHSYKMAIFWAIFRAAFFWAHSLRSESLGQVMAPRSLLWTGSHFLWFPMLWGGLCSHYSHSELNWFLFLEHSSLNPWPSHPHHNTKVINSRTPQYESSVRIYFQFWDRTFGKTRHWARKREWPGHS